jgi:CRP/FNR family transcriptional regulator
MHPNPADLSEVELFQLLDEIELIELASVIESQSVAAGEIIFHAGDVGDSLYVVRSGEIELYVKDTTGQKIVLTVAEKMTCLETLDA